MSLLSLLGDIDVIVPTTGWALFSSLAAFGLTLETFSRYSYYKASLDADGIEPAKRPAAALQAKLVLAMIGVFAAVGLIYTGILFIQFSGARDNTFRQYHITLPALFGGKVLTPLELHGLAQNVAISVIHALLIVYYHARRGFLTDGATSLDIVSLISLAVVSIRFVYLLFPGIPLLQARPPLDSFRAVTELPILWSGMLLVGRILGDGPDSTGKKAALYLFLACFFTLPTVIIPSKFPDRDEEYDKQEAFYSLASNAMYLLLIWTLVMGVFAKAGDLRDADTGAPAAQDAKPASRTERRAKEAEKAKEDKKAKRKGE